ncbi:RsiV family protein [Kerstersia similis]|uniref:RsiV family protein n=1 Tax=Kerstersia similis TaxID=206505 RepID=UPI0039EF8882
MKHNFPALNRSPRSQALLAVSALTTAMLLAACGTKPPTDIGVTPVKTSAALPYSLESWKEIQNSCELTTLSANQYCGNLTVEVARYPTQPALNQSIESQLLHMLDGGQSPYTTIKALRAAFLQSAAPQDVVTLQAKPYRETPSLLVVELETEEYAGGANGMFQTEYLNWSIPQQRALTLDDVLEPGAKPRFETLLRTAFDQWMAAKNLSQAQYAEYVQTWPYQPSNIFALEADGVRILYPLYSIAPRSDGMPVFNLPYSSLEGILKPEYLPAPVQAAK